MHAATARLARGMVGTLRRLPGPAGAPAIALIVALAVPSCVQASGLPGGGVLLAQAGVGLVAPPLEQAAKAAKPTNSAPPPPVPSVVQAGGGPQRNSDKDESPFVVKYIPSYALAVLAAGLGLFVVCRSSGRQRDKV